MNELVIGRFIFATNADGGHFGFWAPENYAGIFRRGRGAKFLLKCPKNPKQVRKNTFQRLVTDPREMI